jgi:hypothetical protein
MSKLTISPAINTRSLVNLTLDPAEPRDYKFFLCVANSRGTLVQRLEQFDVASPPPPPLGSRHRPRSRRRLAAVLIFGQGASASPGQTAKVDVTGAVFNCTDHTSYTVLAGTALFLMHESTDASGGMHVTGTVAPTRVTLSHSSDDATYRLAGASWFGGNFNSSGAANFTDTEHFQILGSGGPVANVSITAHFTQTANGSVAVEFEKNTGTCVPPED